MFKLLSSTIVCTGVALCIYAQTFEVASIRKSSAKALKQKGRTGGPGTPTPEQITWRHRFLGPLVMEAYGIDTSRFRGPQRITPTDPGADGAWDIQATLPANTHAEDVPKMLQALLTERFGLKVHWEAEERLVYRMTVGKGGVKVKLDQAREGTRGNATMEFTTPGGGTLLHATQYSMKDLARLAEQELKEPGAIVQDETGLDGVFTADLSYENFKTALEQDWGLKLERGKGPVQVLVVDEIREEPSEN